MSSTRKRRVSFQAVVLISTRSLDHYVQISPKIFFISFPRPAVETDDSNIYEFVKTRNVTSVSDCDFVAPQTSCNCPSDADVSTSTTSSEQIWRLLAETFQSVLSLINTFLKYFKDFVFCSLLFFKCLYYYCYYSWLNLILYR